MSTSPRPAVRALVIAAGLCLVLLSSGVGALGSPAPAPAPARPTASVVSATPQPAPLVPSAPWADRIGHLIGRRAVSVAVGESGTWLYRHDAGVRRTPASNEKLLLSMAILDRLGPGHTMPVWAVSADTDLGDGVVNGTLWILGSGNPEVGAKTIGTLAGKIENAGIDEVHGRILGSTRGFARDWDAPGWKPSFPRTEVALPTALTYNFNSSGGTHVRDPERRAAAALTKALRRRDVKVTGTPGMGSSPATGLDEVAMVGGPTLEAVVRHMNVPSSNFRAEVLGKLLGLARSGAPGTIAKGAAAIEAYGASHSVQLVANDGSGLSYANRVPPEGMVTLLWFAEHQPWGDDLRGTLPKGGEGTLSGRFQGVPIRAKTGTLDGISALSGWVWLSEDKEWAAFSIISRGMSKDTASHIEDAIVTTLHERAGV